MQLNFSNLYTRYPAAEVNNGWNNRLPKGCLYDNGTVLTDIRERDLPESFVLGKYNGNYGWLNAENVVDVKYVPDYTSLDFCKGDKLYVSYSHHIRYTNCQALKNYDYVVEDNSIIDFLKGICRFSYIDITPFAEQIDKKFYLIKNKKSSFAYDIYEGLNLRNTK